MEIKQTDLIGLFERALKGVAEESLDEIGIVLQVSDNLAIVHGLHNALFGELIEFEGGNKGIIFNLAEDYASLFLLYSSIPVAEHEVAKRTGNLFKTPVGPGLLGRVINSVGQPIDGLGDLAIAEYRAIESEIPGIIERSPVNESLETGITAIDALVPVGKGQRELIIGNRGTGKTAVAIDTILHQKGKNVLCIYVAIGQRSANVVRTIKRLEEHGALAYTVVVVADSSDAVLNQYLAPYVGCAIGEYFMEQGRDALIVYDDLSNHAIAFREMSLLLRRAPGREAYPGDVFYLHSRLLERSGKLLNGGSLTALPLVQIQSDDITAYIPTNLISITDGQIFLDTKLFNVGVRPAVNVELSISRVGGAAQTKAIKKVTKALRLELAQYRELLDFSQFGTELDEVSQNYLARGERAVALLKQPQYASHSFVDQSLMLFTLRENALDRLPTVKVREFALQFVSYVLSVYTDVYREIERDQDISDENMEKLRSCLAEFSKLFTPSEETAGKMI